MIDYLGGEFKQVPYKNRNMSVYSQGMDNGEISISPL
jgi:hypothetical protein